MKKRLLKSTSLFLVFVLTFLILPSLVSCEKETDKRYESYIKSAFSPGPWSKSVDGMVESDTRIFNKNDVTLDFYYGFYSLNYETKEEAKKRREFMSEQMIDGVKTSYLIQTHYAIYLSKSKKEALFYNDDGARVEIFDSVTDVDAQLYKHVTYDEAFEKDYGFINSHFVHDYNYQHSGEKLTIPAEMFDEPSSHIYIYICELNYNVTDDYFYPGLISIIDIKYELCEDGTVIIGY